MIDRALLHGVSQLEKSMRDSASTERKKRAYGDKRAGKEDDSAPAAATWQRMLSSI